MSSIRVETVEETINVGVPIETKHFEDLHISASWFQNLDYVELVLLFGLIVNLLRSVCHTCIKLCLKSKKA